MSETSFVSVGTSFEIIYRVPGDIDIIDLRDQLSQHGQDSVAKALKESGTNHIESGSALMPKGIRSATPLKPGPYLVAIAGPAAGVALPLDRSLTIGRSRSNDFSVRSDEFMSSNNSTIRNDDGRFILEDNDSSNGTIIEGLKITEPTEVDSGTFFLCGESLFAVVDVDQLEICELPKEANSHRPYARRFRPETEAPIREITFPRAIPTHEPAKFTWIARLLGMTTVVGFAAYNERWIFAGIAVVGAILAVAADYFLRARPRELKAVEERASFNASVAQAKQDLKNAERKLVLKQRNQFPSGAVQATKARAGSVNLWLNRRTDPEFGYLTLGFASLPSGVAATGSEGEALSPSTVWGTPVTTSLFNPGPLMIRGERAAGSRIAAGLMLDIANSHSPDDLDIAIASTSGESQAWDWAMFLPHLVRQDGSLRIGTESQSAGTILDEVDRIVEARHALTTRASERNFQALVLVIDGTQGLDGRVLTRVLSKGLEVGVSALVIDHGGQPEGVVSILDHDSGFKAKFQSSTQQRIDNVFIGEFSPEAAMDAARALAPLRPVSQSAKSGTTSDRLMDQLAIPETVSGIVKRWESLGPTMRCQVGMSGGTPFEVDIARQGPHGVIAGTTGSGKTEFLKTLVAGLALSNHPDDLSIVITDFKGGPDHALHRKFPHVIDVSTNLEKSNFLRQVELLDAEVQRRQQHFLDHDVVNIAAYQQARANDPELTPMPRLLVIVDEFAELAEDEDGREQLKKFVSIARVGRSLGVHLLLVTQRPGRLIAGDLEANLAMRFCFRVASTQESNDLIGTAQSAEISAGAPGAAYARMGNDSPVSFQSARVAGRRPGTRSNTAASGSKIAVVSAATAGIAPPKPPSEEVPDKHQDLYFIADLLQQAARETGWDRSAVPWPTSIENPPNLVEVLEAHRRTDRDGTPFGILDRPAKQKREVATLKNRPGVTALVGDSETNLGKAAALIATSTLTSGSSPKPIATYAIDFVGGALNDLAQLPWTAAVSDRSELIAYRIFDELAKRPRIKPDSEPTGVLVAHGVHRLFNADNDVSPLWPKLLEIIEDAESLGLAIYLTGSTTTLLRGRVTRFIQRRLIFDHNDPVQEIEAGLPKGLVGQLEGQAFFDSEEESPGVIARVPDDPKFMVNLGLWMEQSKPEGSTFPDRLGEIDYPLPIEAVEALVGKQHYEHETILLGIDSHTSEPVVVDCEEDGPLIAISGAKGSGKSEALRSVGRLAALDGRRVVTATFSKRSPLAAHPDTIVGDDAVIEFVTNLKGEAVVVLLDDLHRASDFSDTHLKALAAHDSCLILVIAAANTWFDTRPGMLREFRKPNMSGVVLAAPNSNAVRESFGIVPNRFDLGVPRAGVGVGSIASQLVRVQFGHSVTADA